MASKRPIVIDDMDTRVAYDGQWFQDNGSQDPFGNFGPTYLHTLHGTNTNSSFAFSFNGTSVKVLGTNNPTEIGGSVDPRWDCYVDKLQIAASTPSTDRRNNFVLCEADRLPEGEHEITVNVTTHGQTFWFDSIQYSPRDGDHYDTAVTLVENTDAGFEFSHGWSIMPGEPTANLSQVPGASLRFDFTGTSVIWMSWISFGVPHLATTASYSVDGGEEVTFNLPGLPEDAQYNLLNQPMFTIPQLSPGPHSLLVTHHGDHSHTPLILDYLLVTNVTLSMDSTPPTSSGGSSTLLPSPKAKSLLGPIIGGVIGGLVLVVLNGVLLFFLLRRRKQRAARRMKAVSDQEAPAVAPFMTIVTDPTPLGRGLRNGETYLMIPDSTSPQSLHPGDGSPSRMISPSSLYGRSDGPISAGTQVSQRSTQMHSTSWSIPEMPIPSDSARYLNGDPLPFRKGQEAWNGAQPHPDLANRQNNVALLQSQQETPVSSTDTPPLYTER